MLHRKWYDKSCKRRVCPDSALSKSYEMQTLIFFTHVLVSNLDGTRNKLPENLITEKFFYNSREPNLRHVGLQNWVKFLK